MNRDEQKFEEFLQGFVPRRPRPLPLVTGGWSEIRRLAAAAVILVAVGGAFWAAIRSSRTKVVDQQPAAMQDRGRAMKSMRWISSMALTRAALEDRDEFDSQMNDIAPRTLPRFDRADSSLRALAKE